MENYFVYGTLKTRCYNHRIIQHLGGKYIGAVYLRGYKMINCGQYPAIRKSNKNDVIYGEVWSIPENTILDQLEGIDIGLFKKVIENININRNKIKCYVYIAGPLLRNKRKIIPGGAW